MITVKERKSLYGRRMRSCISFDVDFEMDKTMTKQEEFIKELSDAGFDTESGLGYSAGERDFYLELVRDFADRYTRNMPDIRSDYEKEDWENYQIRVHALKTTSRQIGAGELSALALSQERSAGERDAEAIRSGAGLLFSKYEEVCRKIREIPGLTPSGEHTEALRDDSPDSFVMEFSPCEEETSLEPPGVLSPDALPSEASEPLQEGADEWILVVDDDSMNLKTASYILVKNGMRADCVCSGREAVHFLEGGRTPDLILLDIHMPEMDGFETLKCIRSNPDFASIPVIFLTADEDSDSETRGLEAGAMDFIKKPFIPEVLMTRVRHIVELTRLQNNLESQVREKTAEVMEHEEKLKRLNIQIVMTLSSTVDAKDKYTNGHALRVAEYSREIARRAGFSEEKAESIYLIGLLHDVGKIGIPDAIINKPTELNDEEYEITKQHPEFGWHILQNIPEFPELAIGAHWHHERFDGKGYPDGIKGTDIPVEARVIAVADTYDAMTSRRSYRDVLPQDVARAEIANGIGTQFDPVYAKIMLQMIDEDKDYKMRQ